LWFSSPALNLKPSKLKECLAYFTANEDFTILYCCQRIIKITLKLFLNLENKKDRIYDLVLAGIAVEQNTDIIYTKNVKYVESIKQIKIIDRLASL
jgi:predicted nucleic acid-binding protein